MWASWWKQSSAAENFKIFDFLNVRFIHDANFAQKLPHTLLKQARDLANWHEYGVFSDPDPSGIGNSESDEARMRHNTGPLALI